MANIEQEILQPISQISIKSFIEGAYSESKELHRETFLIPVDHTVLAENIRPFDRDFIEVLKENIREHGQFHECIGDIIIDEEGNYKVRIITGQHRAQAIRKINQEGKYCPIRVSVANQTLSPEKIVEIQMSENLQNKMTPAQDATIIHNFWVRLKELRDQEGKILTKSDLARKVGRSADTVSNAIRYIEGVNPLVQRLVDEKNLPYSQALLLSNVDIGDNYDSKQLNLALYFIAKSFTHSQAKNHMKKLKAENGFAGPLFGNEEWTAMEVKNRMIAIRNQADKEGKSAAGWFVKMIHTAEVLGGPQKVRISDAIKESVKELGLSLKDFRELIKFHISEDEYNTIFVEDEV